MDIQKLQTRRIRWFWIVIALGVMIVLFGAGLSGNRKMKEQFAEEELSLKLQLSASQKAEAELRLRLQNVGTSGQVDTDARAQSFVKPDEMRFEIMDAELLDNYTEAEWKILMEERISGQ